MPRRLQEMRLAITAANNTLTHTLGRSPTVADIAAHLDVTEEEVLEGLEGGRAYTATSLSTPAGADGDIELGATLGGEDLEYALADGNLTQQEIAEKIGISQMLVSRLLSRALATLRTQFDA